MGNGPSWVSSAGSGPRRAPLSLFPCSVLVLGEPPEAFGGKELKSFCMPLPPSLCHFPVLTTPRH